MMTLNSIEDTLFMAGLFDSEEANFFLENLRQTVDPEILVRTDTAYRTGVFLKNALQRRRAVQGVSLQSGEHIDKFKEIAVRVAILEKSIMELLKEPDENEIRAYLKTLGLVP